MDSIALAEDLDFSALAAQPAAAIAPAAPVALAVEDAELPVPVKRDLPRGAPSGPTIAGPDEIDLPAPKGAPRDAPPPLPSGVDLPRPKATPPRPPNAAPAAAASTGSVADHDIPLDLDSPDADDDGLVSAGSGHLGGGEPDLPTPVADRGMDGVAPKSEAGDELAPRSAAEQGVAFKSGSAATLASEAEAGDLSPLLEPGVEVEAERAPTKKSGRRAPVVAVAGLVIALAGGAVYTFDPFGLFGDAKLGGGGEVKGGKDAKIAAARRAISDGTAPGLRRAVTDLKPFTDGEKPDETAGLIEAQAHFLLARLGTQGELEKGKVLLERPVVEPLIAERGRAEGLRALAGGDVAGARTKLQGVLAQAPLDANALTYLGTTELLAGNPSAADKAFTQALSAEPTLGAAAYGVGLAKERSGDDKAADEAWAKVLAAHADHARAQIGKQRIAARSGDATAATKIEALLAAQAATLAPRERAEGQVALGQIAAAAGQRNEAEDWFKKAITGDADPAKSLVARDAKLGLARVRVDGGHGAEAIEDLRKLVALEPKNVDVDLLLAEALIDKQEQAAAEPLLTTVQQVEPKSARLACLRGRILSSRTTVAKPDREQAVALFREATAADPKLVAAWANLAATLHQLDRTAEAVEALGKATESLSGDPRAIATLGAAYLAIGRPADAEERFRKVLDGKSQVTAAERIPLWLGLGQALEAQNKLDDAMKVYDEAQTADPKSVIVTEKRANLASTQNKPELAKKLFDEALAGPSPSTALRISAADASIKASRFAEARRLLDAALKDDERSALGNLLLARVEEAEGHPDEALGLARRAAMLRDMPEAHLLLAQLLERSNKLEAASAEYTAARRAPIEEAATLGHARILVRMGSTRDAVVELTPLVKSVSVRAQALLLLGDSYSDLQQADKARHAYEDAVKSDPQLGEASFKLGRALLDAGKRQPGVLALERAVSGTKPGTPWLADAHLLLGDAHRAAHENDAAVRAYKKYLELAPASAPMRREAERQIAVMGGSGAP